MIEFIGYAGSLLVAVSLLMSNIWYLRWINLAGAIAFTVYGVLIPAWPVAGVNGFIILIDVYYLVKMSRAKEHFDLVQAESYSAFLHRFCEYYGEDIAQYFPDFDEEHLSNARAWYVTRDLRPVGLFAVKDNGEVLIDYVTPSHRDLKSARFLYGRGVDEIRKIGIKTLSVSTQKATHAAYLKRMGYEADASNAERFTKNL
ncbi:MAG: hypothetical protein ACI9TH_001945 [Kiritimatiellia bacterium]|jgi:hypothetical protein